ncbi:MAG: hypothetical protein Q7S22_02170 [Candidatus Micrarchaeota archaeon]|nr:hypothetical protein [Candidatus Micrarchaeota archaeon]
MATRRITVILDDHNVPFRNRLERLHNKPRHVMLEGHIPDLKTTVSDPKAAEDHCRSLAFSISRLSALAYLRDNSITNAYCDNPIVDSVYARIESVAKIAKLDFVTAISSGQWEMAVQAWLVFVQLTAVCTQYEDNYRFAALMNNLDHLEGDVVIQAGAAGHNSIAHFLRMHYGSDVEIDPITRGILPRFLFDPLGVIMNMLKLGKIPDLATARLWAGRAIVYTAKLPRITDLVTHPEGPERYIRAQQDLVAQLHSTNYDDAEYMFRDWLIRKAMDRMG